MGTPSQKRLAAKATQQAPRSEITPSSSFRQQLMQNNASMAISKMPAIDPETAAAVGCALPLEEHWEDDRWRGLVEKHLLKSPAHPCAKNIPANP